VEDYHFFLTDMNVILKTKVNIYDEFYYPVSLTFNLLLICLNFTPSYFLNLLLIYALLSSKMFQFLKWFINSFNILKCKLSILVVFLRGGNYFIVCTLKVCFLIKSLNNICLDFHYSILYSFHLCYTSYNIPWGVNP